MNNKIIAAIIAGFAILSTAGNVGAQLPTISKSERSESDRLKSDMSNVNTLIKVGDYERALIFLDKMKEAYGENQAITLAYKRIYLESKKFPELEDLIRQQLARSPNDPMLIAELGNVRFLRNDEGGADSLWNLALDSGGMNSAVYVYVAAYRLQYGDYDGAAAAYLKGREILGKPSAFAYELAGVYEAKRQYSSAIRELLIELNASKARSRMISTKIAGFLKDSDNPDEIIDALNAGAKDNPGNTAILELLGSAYVKTGRMNQALGVYREIGRERKDDGASLCSFADLCLQNKAYSAAIEAADEYAKTSKNKKYEGRAALIKSKALRNEGNTVEAISTLKALSGSSVQMPEAEEALYYLGEIYAEDQHDCQSAIDQWSGLINYANHQDIKYMATVETASCLLKLDRFTDAGSLLSRLVDGNENSYMDMRALFLKGELALISSDYITAKKIYEGVVRLRPGDDYANNALERLAMLSAANVQDSTSGSEELTLFVSGIKKSLVGDSQAAATIFADSSFVGTPLEQMAAFYAASAYQDSGDVDSALDAFEKYIANFPDGNFVDRSYYNIGEIYMANRDTYSQARTAFDTVLKNYPDGPVVEQAREKLRQLDALDKIG